MSETHKSAPSGNTHPYNRHHDDATLVLETGGEDTAHLSLNVYWGFNYNNLIDQLSAAQTIARENHGPISWQVCGTQLSVDRRGVRVGGGKGRYYRFKAQRKGYLFLIAEMHKADGSVPNVRVEIGSAKLMAVGGLAAAWAEILGTLSDLSGKIGWVKINRVDVCVDLPGADIHQFCELVDKKRRYVCRAHTLRLQKEHGKYTGLSLGKGDVVLRIYEKVRELAATDHFGDKEELLIRHRWGTDQERAVRVEFQLRKGVLAELGVYNLDHYFTKRPEILRYLTEKWFRLTRGVPDRENRNTHRTKTHRLWLEVAEAFHAWGGEAAKPAVRDHRRVPQDPTRLMKQAQGCLMSAVAMLDGAEVSCPEHFLDLAHMLLKATIRLESEAEFMRSYQRKRNLQKIREV